MRFRRTAAMFAIAVCAAGTAGSPAHAGGYYKVVKPGSSPADVNPKTTLQEGSPGPDKLAYSYPTSCSGGPRPGTEDLAAYVEHWWPRGESAGIYNCRTVAGSDSLSLHADGRAYDHHLLASDPADKKAGDSIVASFLAKDSAGHRWALARRFGVQEIIWNCQIWTAERADEGLRPYSQCPTSNDTTAHRDHVHIGQNLSGAQRKTTAWTGYAQCIGDCGGTDSAAPEPQDSRDTSVPLD